MNHNALNKRFLGSWVGMSGVWKVGIDGEDLELWWWYCGVSGGGGGGRAGVLTVLLPRTALNGYELRLGARLLSKK